jgi:hypothetical protein
MMWLNSKIPGGHRSSWMKRILLFSIIVCFLVAFNFSFADELTDPDDPEWEHPWDDVCSTESDPDPSDRPVADDVFMLRFGFAPGVIILLQPAEQEQGFEKGRSNTPSEKNRRHLLILIE